MSSASAPASSARAVSISLRTCSRSATAVSIADCISIPVRPDAEPPTAQPGPANSPWRVTARTRYHQTETAATISPLPDGGVEAVFDTPIRAITPGQAVVFYQGDLVVGGGTIR